PRRRGAEAAGHRARDRVHLADAGAGSRADAALGDRAGRGAGGSLHAHLTGGTRVPIADVEVEDERARDVWHDGRARREAAAAGLEPAHDAPDRFAAEPASPAEDDALHGRHEVAGIEGVEPADVVRATAQIDAGDGRAIAQRHA